MRSFGTVVLMMFSLLHSLSEAATRKVPQDYPKIQIAINAAVNGDTVLVDEGTYIENLFVNKKIVLGSYFLLDKNSAHIQKTIIKGNPSPHIDSGAVVTFDGVIDTSAALIGFTITGGKGNRHYYASANWLSQDGGGIFVLTDGGGVRISNNIIYNNMTKISANAPNSSGGGIAIMSLNLNKASYSICENNTIVSNASLGNNASSGGGIFMRSSGRITGTTFIRNISAGWGGAITLTGPFTVLIDRCHIYSNFSGNLSGGIQANGQSGSSALNVTLTNSIVARNNAPNGSAFHFDFTNVTMINNTITDHFGDNPVIRMRQSFGANKLWLVNNIIYNPYATIQVTSTFGTVYSAYNLFNIPFTGTGNITADPNIVQFDTLYRLQSTSPCIKAGISSITLGGVTLTSPSVDFHGMQRPSPGTNNPDIGALQYGSGPILPEAWYLPPASSIMMKNIQSDGRK